MLLNKKGLTRETIVILIVFLIVFGFVGLAISNVLKESGSAVDRTLCLQSVTDKARYKLGIIQAPTELNCKTNNIKIEKPNLNEIKETIAAEFALCARQFGADLEKYPDFLSDKDFSLGKDVFCLPCSKIKFSEKVNQEYPKIEIRDYLNTEKIIMLKGRTVAQYILKDDDAKFSEKEVGDIDTSQNLYVLFYGLKYNTWGQRIGWSTITAGGGTTIVFSIVGGAFGLIGGVPGAITGAIGGAKIGAVVGTILGVGEIATNTGVKPEYLEGFLLVSGESISEQCTELIA